MAGATVEGMDRTEVLMRRGTLALCPDCGDERLMVPVEDDPAGLRAPEFCCTGCDAAVLLLGLLEADAAPGAAARDGARRAG